MAYCSRISVALLRSSFFLPMVMSWSGCSFQLPVAVTDVLTHEETLAITKEPPAEFNLRLHSDGLGWQVILIQKTTTIVSVRGEERWKYRLYNLGGGRRRTADNSNFDDICAIGTLASPLLAPLDIDHPPYWTRWDRLLSMCSQRANAEGAVYEPTERRFRTYHQLRLEPVTEGHLSLVWNAGGRAIEKILIPLTHNSLEHGIDVRLRWLAELLRRKGIRPEHNSDGRVELHLIQDERVMMQKPLAIAVGDLADSLRDDRMVNVPPRQWPTPLVIRIERDHDVLTESERTQLFTRTALLLHRLAVPVVLRGPELEELRQIQAKVHLPSYADESQVEVGHVAGANALLHLDVQQPSSQARVLMVYVVKIETGEILAKVTSGGHASLWPHIVDMAVMQLDAVLQGILPHLPITKVSTRPVMREDRP
jgi:hypothetical protein